MKIKWVPEFVNSAFEDCWVEKEDIYEDSFSVKDLLFSFKPYLREYGHLYSKEEYELLEGLINSKDRDNLAIAFHIIDGKED